MRLQKSLPRRDELLDRRHKAVTFAVADHDVEGHEAATGDPDAGGHHVEVEQFLGVLAAAGDVSRDLDGSCRGVRRHHRADAGELEGHLLARADRVQPLADPLAALVQLKNDVLDLGEARLAYGRALRRLGDDVAARTELERARVDLAGMGARGLVDEIDRELAGIAEGAGMAGPLASA